MMDANARELNENDRSSSLHVYQMMIAEFRVDQFPHPTIALFAVILRSFLEHSLLDVDSTRSTTEIIISSMWR